MIIFNIENISESLKLFFRSDNCERKFRMQAPFQKKKEKGIAIPLSQVGCIKNEVSF